MPGQPTPGGGTLPSVGTSTASSTAGGGATAIPAGTTLILSDAAISSTDISSAMPADAPQGATIPFQTPSGTIVLKNFYTAAQGYWSPLNTVLIEYNPAYAIWYYRDSSDFEIDIPVGGTIADEDTAASQLAAALGVGQQELCSLPVQAVFTIDRGITNESLPLDFCPAPNPAPPAGE